MIISERAIRRIVAEELIKLKRQQLFEGDRMPLEEFVARSIVISILESLKMVNKFRTFSLNQCIDFLAKTPTLYLNNTSTIIRTLGLFMGTGEADIAGVLARNFPTGKDFLDALHKIAAILSGADLADSSLDEAIKYFKGMSDKEYEQKLAVVLD